MSEAKHELVKDEDGNPVRVPVAPKGDAKSESIGEPDWFTGGDASTPNTSKHHFSFEIVFGEGEGEVVRKFRAREMKKDAVKAVTKQVRDLGKQRKAMQADLRKIELALKRQEVRREELLAKDHLTDAEFDALETIETEIGELSQKQETLIDGGEAMLDKQADLYRDVVAKHLTGWQLGAELNAESVAALTMTAARTLGDVILETSMAGGDRVNFTGRKSRR